MIGGVETTGEHAGFYDLLFVIDNGPGANAQVCSHIWFGDNLVDAEIEWNKAPAVLISELGIDTASRGNLRVY